MMRERTSGVVDAKGGCRTCHGSETYWWSRNAVACAARHHDATGHPTWAEQTIVVHYGTTVEHENAERAIVAQ